MNGAPLLRMVGIVKDFPGVRALDRVDFELRSGEIHALLGENGAGKSTLIRVLAGAHVPDSGRIEIEGREVAIPHPADAERAGIAVIHQEFFLVPERSVRDNLFLGRGSALSRVRHADERRIAKELFGRLGVDLDPDALCASLTVAQQQLVEIGKALIRDARILVMDEPTAALSEREVGQLFEIVAGLRKQGLGVVYISHRLEEIERIADRVTVLRDGRHVATRESDTLSRDAVVEMMVGRALEQEFPPWTPAPGEVRLRVHDLRREPSVRGVNFELRGGEVLGLAGLVGSGRTEVARLLYGADRAESGNVELDGRPLRLRSPRDAIGAGIGLLPEDRKRQGLVLGRSARENFALGNGSTLATAGFVRGGHERRVFAGQAKALQIKLSDPEQPARHLSGGNQQKLLLARWLQRDPGVVLFDEPTRGVDVGAKYEIYVLIRELAKRGKSVLVISSEFPEVIGICDRVLVMREGCVVAERVNDGSLTPEGLLGLALGRVEEVAS